MLIGIQNYVLGMIEATSYKDTLFFPGVYNQKCWKKSSQSVKF